MPRQNWRPPSGLPEPPSPVAVEDDQGDDQQPESEPDAPAYRYQHVIFMSGRMVHFHVPELKPPDNTVLCGAYGKYPFRQADGEFPMCEDCVSILDWIEGHARKFRERQTSSGSGRR